ncbi:MAG: DUF2231 domain-containing protein [Acidobacteriota bacterium]|nr:DUF2231 domain-containing protein [Acidobacteriota bacterium]
MDHILPGLQNAPSLHPLFVHFPIALWLTALLVEIVAVWNREDSTHRAAMWLLWLGTVAGTFAVFSGLQAGHAVPSGPAGAALEIHEELMLTSYFIALGLSAFVLFMGQQVTHGLKVVVLVGLLILAAITTIGADRGAEMVYRYGIGVNRTTAVQMKK